MAEQKPFLDVALATNPEPRCPCVLLIDVSGSMAEVVGGAGARRVLRVDGLDLTDRSTDPITASS